jgi:hypothetical protein
MTSDLVRDRALCDLIAWIDAVQELLTDTRENLADPEVLRDALYDAGDALTAAADYLQEVRDERLRAWVSA